MEGIIVIGVVVVFILGCVVAGFDSVSANNQANNTEICNYYNKISKKKKEIRNRIEQLLPEVRKSRAEYDRLYANKEKISPEIIERSWQEYVAAREKVNVLENEIEKIESKQRRLDQKLNYNLNEGAKNYSNTNWFLIPILVVISIPLLYGLGWVWYYICCGFLVIEEPNFFMKIVYGFLSLVGLAFVFEVIALLFGWNPFKR